jgi:hypothetical protein
MRPFLKGFLLTAVPLGVVLGVASGGAVANTSWYGVLFAVGGALTFVALVAGIALAIHREREMAAGFFAGMGVGVLGLVVTCFASLTNI